MSLKIHHAVDAAKLMRDAGYEPDPWQEQLLRSRASRVLLLCGRQMGKSLTTACKAVHRALYHDDSLILLVSRSQDQSDELFRKILIVYNALGRPVKLTRTLVSEIELENGSRVVALPNNPDTVRGYSDCSLLIIDEASRVPDAVLVATTPMIMASHGDIIYLTTPCGPSGFFHDRWMDAGSRWQRITAKASECPRFSPDDLAEARRDLGELMYAQEFCCEFVASSGQVFQTKDIESAFDSEMAGIPGF